MKTLGVLLLLSVALGAAYWNTQRPGEGLDALRGDVTAAVQRLAAGLAVVRDGVSPTDADALEVAGAEATLPDGTPVDVATSEMPEGPVATLNAAANPDAGAGAAAATDAASLAARIDALENELTRTMTSTEANVVQGRLDTLDERLRTLVDTTSGSGGDAAADTALLPRLDALDGRLELLDRRLDQQDPFARLDELSAAIETLQDRLEAGDRALVERLDAADAERATLVDRSQTLATRMTSLAAGGGASEDGTGDASDRPTLDAALDARIAALEDSLASSRGDAVRIGEIDRRLASLDERLAGRNDATDAALGELREELARFATDNQALSIGAVQGEIRDQLASLDAEVEAGVDAGGEDGVAALGAALEMTRERIEELESRVQGLPAASSAADDAQQTQSALESQIAALERRLETLPRETDPALRDSLDQVREQVDQLSASGFVTQAELRAQAEGKTVQYRIYFAKNSVAISEAAARVLDSFIAQESNRTTGVSIFGFTDRAGPASYNQQLAQRRAANVRSYLIQNGFAYNKIGNVAGLGEDAAAALLEDEQEDAQQRVVVLYAAQL